MENTEIAVPAQKCVRQFLDLSTAHLSQDARRWMETQAYANALQQAGARCYPVAAFMHGWVMLVPTADDIVDPEYDDVVPFDLHDACVEARLCGCDYLLFDGDAEIIGSLPVYQDDETSTEGFSEEEQKALAAIADANPGALDGLDAEDRQGLAQEIIDKVDAKVIHPEDGMPMETDAYGGDIEAFLQSHPDTTVQVKGMAVLTAKGIALLLQRHGVDQGLINNLMNRLREAAETRVAAIRKRDAISELKLAVADMLDDIDSEIDQRKTGGNDEDWEEFEAKRNRLAKAAAAL